MFHGVIPILATPFHDDERLDLDSWQRLIEFMMRLEVDGITILGVLGESNRLNDRERETLIGAAVSTVDKRAPVIVGSSHAGTHAARDLAQMAQDLGADAVMVAPGKEPVPHDERILEYYQRIADGLAIPIVLQDHPASTEVHLPVGLILKLIRQVPAIVCLKEEAVPTAPKIRQLREGLDSSVPILTGLGALYAPFDLQAGSNGFNTGFAFPEVLQAMVEAATSDDWPLVYRIYRRFAALIVFEQQPGVAVRKELLRRRGLLTTARARHPGATITPAMSRQLDDVLAATLPLTDLTQALTVEHISEPA
jgi:4-hydroxy-tetrahydrodipicolinate synthase